DPHATYGMVSGFESIHVLQKLPLGEVLRVILLGNHERLSAQRAHQVGLVSEIAPLAELRERAAWVAAAIASAPPVAVQGSLRSIWAGNDLGRRRAPDLAYADIGRGTGQSNVGAGHAGFASA